MQFIRCKLFLLVLLFSFPLYSQIKVDKSGDFWDLEIKRSLQQIEKVDPFIYDYVKSNVDRISVWNSDINSFEVINGERIIFISSKNFGRGSINNLSSTIIHETYHIAHRDENNSVCAEEMQAYLFELNYLFKIKDVETWLVEFVYNKAMEYRTMIEKGTCDK
jgi:predicted metal-dependent peptidase